MRRALLALLLATGFASADPPKPAVVVQARDFAKLFDDYGHMVATALGEKGRKAFQEAFEEDLGEKGLKGLDQLRPWAGYLLTTDKLVETAFVLLVPITKEGDFLDLLDRLDYTADEVPGATGLYEIDLPGESLFLRFHEKYAYIGVHASRAGMDAKKLIPPKQLINPDDLTPVVATLYPDRMSKEWREAAADTVKMIVGQEFFFGTEVVPGAVLLETLTRLNENAKGLEAVRLTAEYDRERREVAVELTAKGAKNSPLAATIAARKPVEHRFGGIAGTAATARSARPEVDKSVRDLLASVAKQFGNFAMFALEGDTILTPLLNASLDTFQSAVAKNATDFAFALDGPDRNGQYAATFALGLADTKKLDDALRKFAAAKRADGDAEVEAIQKAITLDAAKIGDVAVHTLQLGGLIPKECKELLGDKAEVAVALTKDAAFVAVGVEAVGRMKAALAAKPAAGDPLMLTVVPKALAPLLEKLDLPNHFGESDKPLSLLRATLSGGESLKLRATFNLKLLALFHDRD